MGDIDVASDLVRRSEFGPGPEYRTGRNGGLSMNRNKYTAGQCNEDEVFRDGFQKLSFLKADQYLKLLNKCLNVKLIVKHTK